tara:strand:- start:311 stop:508 length:198 start_codon:yes stop_codon:yes gene_type:complete
MINEVIAYKVGGSLYKTREEALNKVLMNLAYQYSTSLEQFLKRMSESSVLRNEVMKILSCEGARD